MKALRFYAKRDIRFENADAPIISDEKDVKIKVKAVGICGSDVSRYAKLGPYVPGNVWGHEFSGEVVEVGSDVTKVKVGQKVTACPALFCGKCEACQKSIFAQCENLDVIGAHRYGAFAEYIVMPERNVVPIPDEVDYDDAAMVEPSCVVVHGYYKTGIKAGDTVVVVGCGTIGLLAIEWAKIFGAKMVIALDIDDTKLELAKKVGADHTVNTMGKEPSEEVQKVNNGKGTDIVIESAGTPITSAQSFSLSRKGGKVLFVGIPYGDVMVKRLYFEKIVRCELSVYGSWNAISAPFPGQEWETTVHCLKTGQLNVKPLITHVVPLSKGREVFEITAERKEPFGKIIFHPED
ncbi:galactitol-1-phosphate 5-dehydrogenase [Pectinatus haikarae]|uniref:L-iditol 2-dehydrogenase n=1 Tax=Pectinatus haikarae TaxID=349096 RepID=A0ABT9YBL5_9FIRM|nr:galactitol-1-phosphate 5-dehydrogenase [Pectinatus haikarae]MDQ0205089.1 L-iditol 2-dehydrogenase [Pectinatus haikarae]